jgi:hypothetical protein
MHPLHRASILLCTIATISGAAIWRFHFDSAAPTCDVNCQHDQFKTMAYLKALHSSNAGIVILGNGSNILRNLETDTAFWHTILPSANRAASLMSFSFDTTQDHFLLPDMRSRLSAPDAQTVVTRSGQGSPAIQIFAFPIYSDGIDSAEDAYIRWVGGMEANGCDSILAKGQFKTIGHYFSIPSVGSAGIVKGATSSPMVSALDSTYDMAVNYQWLNMPLGHRMNSGYLVFTLVATLPSGSTCPSSTPLSITTDFIELVVEGTAQSTTSTIRPSPSLREHRIRVHLRDPGVGDGFDPHGRPVGRGAGIELGGK